MNPLIDNHQSVFFHVPIIVLHYRKLTDLHFVRCLLVHPTNHLMWLKARNHHHLYRQHF